MKIFDKTKISILLGGGSDTGSNTDSCCKTVLLECRGLSGVYEI